MEKEKLDNESLNNLIEKIDGKIENVLRKIDKLEYENTKNVLNAFHNHNLSESDLGQTTGYGYGDIGRDKIDEIFADVLKAESAIARGQFLSGTHALTVALFGLLRPNDTLLSISGTPYDTLQEVIGIIPNNSSLASYGILYEEISLKGNDFDTEKIIERLKDKSKNRVKVIEVQKSIGYSSRKTIDNEKLKNIIEEIRKVDKDVIIMVDNCYCEFVEETTAIEAGADIVVGSLIKNLGGGIAPNGGYVAGKENLVDLISERLTVPGQGREVGASLGLNRQILLGLYHAPSAVASSLKTAIFAAAMLEELGYDISPKYNEDRADIVQKIIFGNEKDVISYTQGIQKGSAIDSMYLPEPSDMPGYDDNIIMASGSFVSGSSIEISCDGPLRPPYIAYQQGGITYSYGKFAVIEGIKRLKNIE